MSMRRWAKIGSAAFVALWLCVSAEAKVSAEQAAKLGERGAEHGDSGSELTPVGARRAGNAEGSIPSWTGGLEQKTVAAGERHENPFPQDEVVFKITAENYREYEDKLSEGMVAMLKKYPETFYLPVYRTRRTASYPQQVYDRSIEGAGRVTLEGTDGIEGLVGTGFPFPIPGNGAEAMWNHITRYRGDYEDYYANLAVVARDGAYQLTRNHRELEFVYGKLNADPREFGNVNIRFLGETVAPARMAGLRVLSLVTLDQRQQPTIAWVYNPGQRRVRLAPSFLHDAPQADGLMTADQTDAFSGSLSRYHWKLIGKKEMYIGYNNYAFQQDSSRVSVDDVIRPGHLNPALTRYELHRVWVVEATLKPGKRHVYHKRRFYLDEDSWTVVHTDLYDDQGRLWRVHNGHITNFYTLPMTTNSLHATYDLFSGRYALEGLDNGDEPRRFDVSWPASHFTPASLRATGLR